jgi:hypothetical protein
MPEHGASGHKQKGKDGGGKSREMEPPKLTMLFFSQVRKTMTTTGCTGPGCNPNIRRRGRKAPSLREAETEWSQRSAAVHGVTPLQHQPRAHSTARPFCAKRSPAVAASRLTCATTRSGALHRSNESSLCRGDVRACGERPVGIRPAGCRYPWPPADTGPDRQNSQGRSGREARRRSRGRRAAAYRSRCREKARQEAVRDRRPGPSS